MQKDLRKQQALEYHAKGRPGKIEVIPTKEAKTQRDLSLAYSPGVAEPCKEIHKNVEEVYKYTAKGNLVAVISNGTAVLGLGDIGPEASKPVMEGKGVLFKIFADIDVFDIEINEKDPEKFVQIVNSLELQKKKIDRVKFVINGAGAAAMACVKLYVALGAKPDHFIMFDKDGVLHEGRSDLDEDKRKFAVKQNSWNLDKAMKDADVFVGLSVGNVVTKEMVKSMARRPIVFAMANPDPEISYESATEIRDDIIMAPGRSDYPNQVNNVLGFPFIFRGAMDVRATQINEIMKLAAVQSLANLTKTV